MSHKTWAGKTMLLHKSTIHTTNARSLLTAVIIQNYSNQILKKLIITYCLPACKNEGIRCNTYIVPTWLHQNIYIKSLYTCAYSLTVVKCDQSPAECTINQCVAIIRIFMFLTLGAVQEKQVLANTRAQVSLTLNGTFLQLHSPFCRPFLSVLIPIWNH